MSPGPAEPERLIIAAIEERSRSRLEVARELLDHSHYEDAVSLSLLCSLPRREPSLLLRRKDLLVARSTGAAFNKDYVSTHLLPEEAARTLRDLFELRQSTDYDVTGSIEETEAESSLRRAEDFVSHVIVYARSTHPNLFNILE